MKKISFNKIKIKNFLSVGATPVEVQFRPGLHIITGVNKDKEDRRNGVGKSTIADAIYFSIFGDTLRDLKKEHIINNINKKNCEVTLELSIESENQVESLKIVRSLEPSKCFLYINGEDKTHDSITNTTNYILKKLSCTSEIFQNCIIMTINNTIPFMAKKKQEKRKFIEDIFNLGIFSNMLNILKVDINEKKKHFEIITARYEDGIKTLASYEKQKKEALEEKQKKIQKYTQRQENNAKELLEIETKISKFQTIDVQRINNDVATLHTACEELDNRLQSLRHNKSEKATLIQQLTKQHNNIGTELDKCPMCFRGIQEQDKNHIIIEKQKIKDECYNHAQEIEQINNSEKKIIEKNNNIKNKIIELNNKVHQYDLAIQQNNNLLQRKDQLEQWQKMLEQDLKDLENTTLSATTAHDEQQETVTMLTHEINETKKSLTMLDVVKFVVSEEGVKSYVVKKILKLFNNRLNYYLNKMDANCKVSFNEYFEEEIVDIKGKICSYNNFSGAERKNIDLACLFTFMDIRRLQGDVSFNFSIYDELFDSSLDEKGVELVTNILKERVEKYKESIMVISHRKESTKAATGDIIYLEKVNGITRRVDFNEHQLKL